MTLTLLAINLGLRYQHNFTVISPSINQQKKEPNTESNFKPQEEFISSSTEKHFQPSGKSPLSIPSLDEIMPLKHSEAVSSHNEEVGPPLLDKEAEPLSDEEPFLEIHQKSKESPHSVAAVTAQNVESMRQQVLVSPSLTENLSQPSEKSHPSISPLDEIPVNHSEAVSSHNKEVEPPLIDKEAEPLSLEEFKEKLKYFDAYDENLHRIAKDLFKIAPKTIELTEITNLIFAKCSGRDILLLLNAILIAHPSLPYLHMIKYVKQLLKMKDILLTIALL